MSYESLGKTIPATPNLQEVQNSANYASPRPQKTCINPLFQCFSPSMAHMDEKNLRAFFQKNNDENGNVTQIAQIAQIN